MMMICACAPQFQQTIQHDEELICIRYTIKHLELLIFFIIRINSIYTAYIISMNFIPFQKYEIKTQHYADNCYDMYLPKSMTLFSSVFPIVSFIPSLSSVFHLFFGPFLWVMYTFLAKYLKFHCIEHFTLFIAISQCFFFFFHL